MSVDAKIKSNKGFYVGDVCYVLGEEMYYEVWGKSGFPDGVIVDPKTNMQFCVASTAYGDGDYYDGSYNSLFHVDAGNIGLVPLELVEKTAGLENGNVVNTPGYAFFNSSDGFFEIGLPNNGILTINTDW